MPKSTIEEIRKRFDADVERFSNLDTGQQTTIDAPLSLELITEAASRLSPRGTQLLDIGCGAGNYTLKMLQKLPGLHSTLIDLSKPMLERARQRVQEAGAASLTCLQEDIRKVKLPAGQFDIVLAGAVLHHLRGDEEWQQVFKCIYDALKPEGSFWISDLVSQEHPVLHDLIWERYGQYLESTGGSSLKQKAFDYIEKEDSPRPVSWQLELLKAAGFRHVEILHKNSCFAAFGAIK